MQQSEHLSMQLHNMCSDTSDDGLRRRLRLSSFPSAIVTDDDSFILTFSIDNFSMVIIIVIYTPMVDDGYDYVGVVDVDSVCVERQNSFRPALRCHLCLYSSLALWQI